MDNLAAIFAVKGWLKVRFDVRVVEQARVPPLLQRLVMRQCFYEK